MRLALFDFDGTITNKDSLEDFIQFAVGRPKYYWGLFVLSPILVGYLLKIIPNDIAKQKLFTYFFSGWSEQKFSNVAMEYGRGPINQIVRESALERIQWHQSQGDKLVLVSASMEYWLKPWADKCGFDLVSTKLEIIDGKITGKFSNKNCYGQEKVGKIKRRYQLTDYSEVYAYGDTSGDKPMLALADKAFYREFE